MDTPEDECTPLEVVTIACVGNIQVFGRALNAARNERNASNALLGLLLQLDRKALHLFKSLNAFFYRLLHASPEQFRISILREQLNKDVKTRTLRISSLPRSRRQTNCRSSRCPFAYTHPSRASRSIEPSREPT
jgi:hypothetical protein